MASASPWIRQLRPLAPITAEAPSLRLPRPSAKQPSRGPGPKGRPKGRPKSRPIAPALPIQDEDVEAEWEDLFGNGGGSSSQSEHEALSQSEHEQDTVRHTVAIHNADGDLMLNMDFEHGTDGQDILESVASTLDLSTRDFALFDTHKASLLQKGVPLLSDVVVSVNNELQNRDA